MPLLYYWRGDNYRRDLDQGASYHLNQGNPALHDIGLGDCVWAFTRRADGCYVMAAELVIKAKTFNPSGYRYGPYRVWGDLERSPYFKISEQRDVTPLIRGLSIKAGGATLGRAFQGKAAVRKLNASDARMLRSMTESMHIEERSRLLPEERLEVLLNAGDEDRAVRLVARESSGLSIERKQYLMTEVPRRSRAHVEQLRELYWGRCQICSWEPRLLYQADVCEAHHVRCLGRGGDDSLANLVLLCPNHHRIIHKIDAPFDWSVKGFAIGDGFERLRHLDHELLAD
jgi:hypothetical protein